jgi:peptidoglycan/xylan/chitin deacetylase (PgdA/CDA1 family)
MNKIWLKKVLLSFISVYIIILILGLYSPNFKFKNQLAVIMYHHVDDKAVSTNTITKQLFREQLSNLQNKGYHFVNLAETKAFLQGSNIADKAILVTFDDGYESFYKNAYPILKSLNIPAVNFDITNTLSNPKVNIPKLSAKEIKFMIQDSPLVEIQCHTDSLHVKTSLRKTLLVTHLTNKGKDESDKDYFTRVSNDTKTCIKKLEPLNRGVIDTYAYPYGILSKEAIDAISSSGIKYAFTINSRMTTRKTDLMRIPRINAGGPDITADKLEATIKRFITKP